MNVKKVVQFVKVLRSELMGKIRNEGLSKSGKAISDNDIINIMKQDQSMRTMIDEERMVDITWEDEESAMDVQQRESSCLGRKEANKLLT